MRHIPGFYYDPIKKKYFRLIDNNRRADGSMVFPPASSSMRDDYKKTPSPNSLPDNLINAQLYGNNQGLLQAKDKLTVGIFDNLKTEWFQSGYGRLLQICPFPEQNLFFGSVRNRLIREQVVGAWRMDEQFQHIVSASDPTVKEMEILQTVFDPSPFMIECVYLPDVHKFMVYKITSEMMFRGFVSTPNPTTELLMVETYFDNNGSHGSLSYQLNLPCATYFVCPSPNGHYFAIGQSHKINFYDLVDDRLQDYAQVRLKHSGVKTTVKCGNWMNETVFAIGSIGGHLGLVDYRMGQTSALRWQMMNPSTPGPINSIEPLQCGPGYQLLISGMQNNLSVVDCRWPRMVQTRFEGYVNPNSNLRPALCKQRNLVIAPNEDGMIRIWKLSTGQMLKEYHKTALGINSRSNLSQLRMFMSDRWKHSPRSRECFGMLMIDDGKLVIAKQAEKVLEE